MRPPEGAASLHASSHDGRSVPYARSVTEYIEIRGARENNLKDVSLRIPKRKITIFTGVSGSGKSSIVFDTIATEAQRFWRAGGASRPSSEAWH
jgi:ABC-type transport system involved in cytochrome bd biosynthesis fused ATPase/permease subunit